MAFKTQRLANRFPGWTKIRRDPSSVGQRLLSVFADYFDLNTIESIKIRDEFRILKPSLGVAALYSIQLDASDQIKTTPTAGGGSNPIYHTSVVGTHPTEGNITLKRDENIEDLLFGPPTRISLVSTIPYTTLTIWDSTAPEVFNEIVEPNYLYVNVFNSTKYNLKTISSDHFFSGFHGIFIEGRDQNNIQIREKLEIPDDGYFKTKHIFSEVSKVEIDGFDGQVTIHLVPDQTPWATPRIVDPFRLAVLEDDEGPLHISIEQELAVGNTVSYLRYFTPRLKLGEEYRDGSGEIIGNEEEISEAALLDSSSNPLDIISIAISPDTARLYALSRTGIIYIYDLSTPVFLPPAGGDRTRYAPIEIRPLQHTTRWWSTMRLFTWFAFPKKPILSVKIKRVSPSGTIEYLQADKVTWSTTEFEFTTDPVGKLPEDSWQDFQFDTTFEEFGQWDFYAISRTQSETSTYHTAVQVASLKPLVSFDSTVTNPIGIYFSENGNLKIWDASNIYEFSQHRDSYVADPTRQQLIIREAYNSVTVTP